jgi:Fic family protein
MAISGTSHTPAPSALVSVLVNQFCNITNIILQDGQWDGFSVAALILWWMCHVHPYEDGNGRVGRALALAVLAWFGIVNKNVCGFHARFHESGFRLRYVEALQKVNEQVGICPCCSESREYELPNNASGSWVMSIFEPVASVLRQAVGHMRTNPS